MPRIAAHVQRLLADGDMVDVSLRGLWPYLMTSVSTTRK
jgi:hypothetical protein